MIFSLHRICGQTVPWIAFSKYFKLQHSVMAQFGLSPPSLYFSKPEDLLGTPGLSKPFTCAYALLQTIGS